MRLAVGVLAPEGRFQTNGLEEPTLQVAFERFLAHGQLAAEQLAEALEGHRAILKLLARRELRLRQSHGFPIARHVANFAARDTAGEREKLPDGNLGFPGIGLPLREGNRNFLIKPKQSILPRHDCEHADETFGAAGKPMRNLALVAVQVFLEDQPPVAINEQSMPVVSAEILSGGL